MPCWRSSSGMGRERPQQTAARRPLRRGLSGLGEAGALSSLSRFDLFSPVFHDVNAAAWCGVTDSRTPAAQVQPMATIRTAPVKANCVVVPQIPSGRANKKANPTATPPAQAVETRRALKSVQRGPDHEQADQDDPGLEE